MRDDDREPLLPARANRPGWWTPTRAVATVATLAMVALASASARGAGHASTIGLGAAKKRPRENESATAYATRESARRERVSALGYKNRTTVLPWGPSPTLTYTLHVGCENAEGGFFDDIQEARIVRHGYGEHDFFEWESGLVMNKVNLFPGDAATFSLDTDGVNWEWGFAVKNSQGEIRYEIGTALDGAPLARNDLCANSFGPYNNRIIGWDSRLTPEPGYIDYVFGSCARNCIPTGDPHSWSDAERSKNTAKMLANPPRGLGSSFKMYGVAGKGWCTVNIHTQRGNSDDIMLVFNPRPVNRNIAMDTGTGCTPAVTDPNGQCNWAGNLEYIPWNDAEMGVVQSTDMSKPWVYEFTYLANGMGITLNGEQLYTYTWRSSDAGYDAVSYIQMNGGQPSRVYRTGECDLVASAHPRVAKEHPENLLVGVKPR